MLHSLFANVFLLHCSLESKSEKGEKHVFLKDLNLDMFVKANFDIYCMFVCVRGRHLKASSDFSKKVRYNQKFLEDLLFVPVSEISLKNVKINMKLVTPQFGAIAIFVGAPYLLFQKYKPATKAVKIE